MVKSFFDLREWKEAHELCLKIYQTTVAFPKEELYGLTSQLRRSSASVGSNIAEGMGRAGTKDLIRFLVNARGSTQEIIYQLYLAKDLGYITKDQCVNLNNRYNGLAAGINAHIKSLSNRIQSKTKSLNH